MCTRQHAASAQVEEEEKEEEEEGFFNHYKNDLKRHAGGLAAGRRCTQSAPAIASSKQPWTRICRFASTPCVRLFFLVTRSSAVCVRGGYSQSVLLKRTALVAGALTAIALTGGLFPLSLVGWRWPQTPSGIDGNRRRERVLNGQSIREQGAAHPLLQQYRW